MKKHIAYCKNHDWEGMRRDDKSEAQLDLNSHIELYPSESHDNSGINIENASEKSVLNNDDHKPGSTHAKCDRNGCGFHRGVDSFKVGKDRVRVKMKAITDGVSLKYVKLVNTSGGQDYKFSGLAVDSLNGTSKLINKGEYRIVPDYDGVGNRTKMTLFVHW